MSKFDARIKEILRKNNTFYKCQVLSGGCLFHGELSTSCIEIDMLWEAKVSTDRVYTRFEKGYQKVYEDIQSTGQGEPQNREEGTRLIALKCQEIERILTESYGSCSWALEGFWHPETGFLTVLQLRPTPRDRLFPLSDPFLKRPLFFIEPTSCGEISIQNLSLSKTYPKILWCATTDRQRCFLTLS